MLERLVESTGQAEQAREVEVHTCVVRVTLERGQVPLGRLAVAAGIPELLDLECVPLLPSRGGESPPGLASDRQDDGGRLGGNRSPLRLGRHEQEGSSRRVDLLAVHGEQGPPGENEESSS